MPTITKSRSVAAGEIPFKHAWARLPLIGIDRDPAIVDLAYLFAGLVTITQSCLVHCMLQGVEHTDPTEWSNSHRSIGDKFVMAVRRTFGSFQRPFTIFRHLVIRMMMAPQHSNNPKALSLSRNGSQQYIRITYCLQTAYTYNNYISKYQRITIITTQIKYIHSLCRGSNSLRVHKQLMWGCLNSSEPNSSEHGKSWSAPRHLVYWL